MKKAPIPLNEKERLKSLRKLKILDTSPEERFDRITRLAAFVFNILISTVTLVDSNREWFKSCQGLAIRQGKRAISFCGHAMLAKDIFIIPDAKKDPRFADNPMVTGKPYVRFYAGVPLFSADGQRVGTFCIKDRKARRLNNEQIKQLKALASWAELELNSRQLSRALAARKIAEVKILEFNEVLKLLNKLLRHDVLNDLTVMEANLDLWKQGKTDKESINDIFTALNRSKDLIKKMRELEGAVSVGRELGECQVREVVDKVVKEFPKLKFKVEGEGVVMCDKAFISVIRNIITNAKTHGKTDKIDVQIKEGDMVQISIADYGKGIPDKIKKKLFVEGFKYGKTGHTGLGLYIVRKTIERYGGKVSVKDNKPKGAIFTLTLQKAKTAPNQAAKK